MSNGTSSPWWILSIAVIFILLLWLPSNKKPQPIETSERQEPEYDFMNSEEAMPAKLDLARAYLDMGDHKAAQQVLEEVVAKGNKTEKRRAQQLLKKAANAAAKQDT